jgi:hypothetical protein
MPSRLDGLEESQSSNWDGAAFDEAARINSSIVREAMRRHAVVNFDDLQLIRANGVKPMAVCCVARREDIANLAEVERLQSRIPGIQQALEWGMSIGLPDRGRSPA